MTRRPCTKVVAADTNITVMKKTHSWRAVSKTSDRRLGVSGRDFSVARSRSASNAITFEREASVRVRRIPW